MLIGLSKKILRMLSKSEIRITIPMLGLGCGVLGLSLVKSSKTLGQYASKLLRALEYRGYDSTGAVFQDDNQNIKLFKDVGAPSTLVKTLGIEKQAGKTFCGQVRWATFGRVDRINSQPHIVKCKQHIYGAHNGNITNTRELKKFLTYEGHTILSDNDGEMLVHTIEHYFDNEMDKLSEEKQMDFESRKKAMRNAIIRANEKFTGSFAAVVVDPVTETMYAIKAGSSLYFGVGEVDGNGFTLASSDLTAVLRFTKNLVDLREGEFAEFSDESYKIYAFKSLKNKITKRVTKPGTEICREAVRSKLRAEDTELHPNFDYFMEQEIYAESETTGKLIKLFTGGSNTRRYMMEFMTAEKQLKKITELHTEISKSNSFETQLEIFYKFIDSDDSKKFYNLVQKKYPQIYDELVKENFENKYFFSSDKNLFIELIGDKFDKKKLLIAKALDSITETDDVSEVDAAVIQFLKIIEKTISKNGNIYTIACGSSFHAAKIGALFFNEISETEIIPILPGDFRGQYSKSLRKNDVVIGVSQSGETKDLIDIFNDIDKLDYNLKKIVLVNNQNSTLGQEKSDVSIPIFCGPEIAVPATKSFLNQIALFYFLAIKVLEMKKNVFVKNETKKTAYNRELKRRYKSFSDIPFLIRETIETSMDQIEEVAHKIYMEPSMHLLATKITGVAKEGALKIRETVLNHAEGGEASEFKHGPNTILGRNTVFGVKSIKALIKYYNKTLSKIEELAGKRGIESSEIQEIVKATSLYFFTRTFPFNLSREGTEVFKEIVRNYNFFENMYRNYPLIYVTGPDERDVNLTISQINTHKIRGADTFVIAEENDKLLENVRQTPDAEKYYGWGYIFLPKTGDSLMTTFSSTVVLQLLALKMSVRKMQYLDRLGVHDHGVHPDVPKNVSKSITVD